MGRFSYSSGADELVKGYQLGTSISDRMQKNKMDEETAAALARQQTGEQVYGIDGKGAELAPESAGPVEQGGLRKTGEVAIPQPTSSRYTLGGETQATERTPGEVRGLNRQAAKDVLGKYGDEGAKRIAQLDNEDVAGMRMKGLQRTERKASSDEKFNNELKPMYSELGRLSPGSPEYAAKKEKINAAITTNDYVKGRENMLAELNLSDKQFEVKKKVAEKEIWDSTATPEAFGKALTEKYHDGKTYGVHIDARTGAASIVMEGENGGIVKTAPSWKELQDEVRSAIPALAEAMVVNNEKIAAAKRLADSNERIAAMRAKAAANLKYSSIRDDEGNIYNRQKDGTFKRPDGIEFDAEKHGEPTYLGSPARPKAADIVKASAAFDAWARTKANKMPVLAESWLKTDATDKEEYTKAMADWLPRANAQREVLGLPPLEAPTKGGRGLNTDKVSAPAPAPAGMPSGSVQHGGKWGQMKEGKFFAYRGQ